MKNTEDMYKTYHRLTSAILQKLYSGNPRSNLVFSPFSVMMLLGILADATQGNTRKEILASLFPDKEYEDVIDDLKKLQSVLTKLPCLRSANAVCVNHRIEDTIVPGYADRLKHSLTGNCSPLRIWLTTSMPG